MCTEIKLIVTIQKVLYLRDLFNHRPSKSSIYHCVFGFRRSNWFLTVSLNPIRPNTHSIVYSTTSFIGILWRIFFKMNPNNDEYYDDYSALDVPDHLYRVLSLFFNINRMHISLLQQYNILTTLRNKICLSMPVVYLNFLLAMILSKKSVFYIIALLEAFTELGKKGLCSIKST